MSDDMLTNWRRLVKAQMDAIHPGLQAGADIIEPAAAATTAYRGMSGATRASTNARVVDANNPNDAEIIGSYNAAAGLLRGFTGHEGQAHLGMVRGPSDNEAWIILTVPTDYAISLETENAGEKAFIADTLHQEAPTAFQVLIGVLRGAWRL